MSLKGKGAEKKINKHLKKLLKHPDWWSHRLPDAAACMGRLQKQPADYILMYKGLPILFEVKEENRPDRLTRSRLTQLPKMRLFAKAGGVSVFLIYHYNQDIWRLFFSEDINKDTPLTMDVTCFPPIESIEEVFIVLENLVINN